MLTSSAHILESTYIAISHLLFLNTWIAYFNIIMFLCSPRYFPLYFSCLPRWMWHPGSRGTKRRRGGGRKRSRKRKKLRGSLQGWWMWGCVTQVSLCSCQRKKDTQTFTILIPMKYHLSNAVLLPGTRDPCQKAVSPHAAFFQRQRLGLRASRTHPWMGANEHILSLSPTPTVMHSSVYLLFHPN